MSSRRIRRAARPLAALVALAFVAGCSGIPCSSPRFTGALEVVEIPLGCLALPFCLLMDGVRLLFRADDLAPTLFALTLLNPVCNGLDGSTDPSRRVEAEFDCGAPPEHVTNAAMRWLLERGFAIELSRPGYVATRARRVGQVSEVVGVRARERAGGSRVEVVLGLDVGDLVLGPKRAERGRDRLHQEELEDEVHRAREERARPYLDAASTSTREDLRAHLLERYPPDAAIERSRR